MKLHKHLLLLLALLPFVGYAQEKQEIPSYKVWYDAPALNRGGVIPPGESERPIDLDWERWSLPIGNGYMGASIFGGTSTERIQLTDKTLYIRGLWGWNSHTSFGDLYLDFFHPNRSNYERNINLNEGTAHVTYDYNNVTYTREYFVSYPDNALVIKLTASKPGALSFTVRPEIAHLVPFGKLQRTDSLTIGYLSGPTQTRFSYNGKRGKVKAEGNTLSMRGETEYLKLKFAAKMEVIPTGGTITAYNNASDDHGTLRIEDADEAVIILTMGTNYKLSPQVFANKPAEKLAGFPDPYPTLEKRLDDAVNLGYEKLHERHTNDFSSLFNRVQLHLASTENIPTNQLLENYKTGKRSAYLEELFFHYGRYLLISSARPGALPPTLLGAWNQYEQAPWNGNYTHNINIQMNYWPAFNTNLAELFEGYVAYHKAYKSMAEEFATNYLKETHPENVSSKPSGNGWTMGIGSGAYSVSMPSGHSGPGVVGFTAKLFWDYYAFTGNKTILEETAYPSLYGASLFLSKVTTDTLGYLLATPSASPEQFSKETGKPYPTIGCAFDQQMIYENHMDAIKAAALVKDRDKALKLFQAQTKRLDPVQIGYSGQIKEYREEKFYGDLVLEQNHRHISHLVGLFPGTLINGTTPAWLDAAKVTLNRRGDYSTGWSMAHKLNLWARTKEGERAHDLLQTLLENAVHENLWTTCLAVINDPYDIDANFGSTAGIAEMLLQSHEGYIDLLPALPSVWKTGSYNGLTARGNFEVSASWNEGSLTRAEVLSRGGEDCAIHYPQLTQAQVVDGAGKRVKFRVTDANTLRFKTKVGERYTVTNIPERVIIEAPTALQGKFTQSNQVALSWEGSSDAASYTLYRSEKNNPTYEVVAQGITETSFLFTNALLNEVDHLVFKVVAMDSNGNPSKGITTAVVKE